MPQQPQPSYGPPPGTPYGTPPQAPYGQPYSHQTPYPQAPHSQPYPSQQPYGQQPAPPYGVPYPHPHPAAWAPPPKKKGGLGLALGIVGGVVGLAVIGTLGIGLNSVREQPVSGFPTAEYELTLPKTLLDGEYELTQDLSDSEGDAVAENMNAASYARDVKGIVGMYGVGGDEAAGQLSISGSYGRFKDTDTPRDGMLRGAATGAGVTVVQEPTDFEPAGSDVTITCQVLALTETGATLPMCAWADGNTMASVGEVTTEISAQEPEEVDMAAFADRTARIRSEIRQAIS